MANNLQFKLNTAETKKKISDSIMKSGIMDMPQKNLNAFEIMSKVQDLLQDTINPINAKLPKIYNDISQINSKILGFDVSVKNQTKEIEYMKSQFDFLRNLEKQVKRIESSFDAEKALNLDKFSVQEANNSQVGKRFEMVDTQFTQVQQNIDSKDDFVRSQVKLQEKHQFNFTDRFDKIFEDLTKDRKRLEKRMAQFDEQVNQYKTIADQQKKFVEEQMLKYIKETFDKYKIDDNKIIKIDREVQKIQTIEKRAKEMERTIGKLVDDRNDLHVNSMFLARSLPILNHLQINDALESVIGIDYQEKLIDFQRAKNKELLEYAQNCQVKCIKFLNQRLFTYLKFMTEEDSGCLPFKFGHDIHPNLTENQLVVVEEKNQLILRNKFKDLVENKKIINELFDICARQGKRNDILIEHKLKRAQNNGPLHQVKKLILEHRTLQLKNYDDLDVHLQIKDQAFNPNQSTQPNEPKAQKQEEKNQQNSGFQSPKPVSPVNISSMKFFLIQGEQLRPYQRFQKKFMSLFNESYKDFKEFKTKQFINLSEQTKFSLEIVKDIENIKQNIQNIESDLDQNNSDNFNRNIELRAEITSKQDELFRKVNFLEYQCKENQYNLNKYGKQIEYNLEKIDENTSMMDKRFEFLDQQLQEIQEENFVEQLHDFQQQSRQGMDTMKQELIYKFQTIIDEKLSKFQSISVNTDKQPENISQNNKLIQKKPTSKLVEQKKIEKVEVKEIQKDKKRDANNASPLSLKQQKKQELQKMLDEKKKKADIAEQKKKEREEQSEASRIQKMLEMEQQQKAQEEERKRKEAVEKWQKEEQARKEKRDQLAMLNKSSLNKGEELIYSLQNQMTSELIKTENIMSKSSNMIKEQQSQKTPQHTQQSQQVKQTSKFEESEYQDVVKPGKFSSQIPIFTPEKTKQEQIQLINEQILIWNNKLKLEFSQVIKDQLSKKLDPLQQLVDQEVSCIKGNQQQLNEYVNKAVGQIATQQDQMNQSFFDYKKFNEIEFQNINNTLKNEESQYRKMKIQVKGQITFELDKLAGFHTKSDYEFKRINYILRQNQILISTMLEDIQINQLIQEQDVQDKQELGLFGFKKNQELMGTNQGAMTNMYEKNKDLQKGTSRENHGEWDMKNKNKTYDEVVIKNNIDPVTQMQSFLQKQEDNYLESAQNFSPDQHKCGQNRLQVSKQCASCWGFAPIILQQIKFACLSYISSPICYAEGFKMMNGDLLRIKQRLLKKCEIINANVNEFLVKNQSNYSILSLNFDGKTSNGKRNKIALISGDSTMKNNTSQMAQIDTFQTAIQIEIDQLQNATYQTNDKMTLRESIESQVNQNNQQQQYLTQDQNQLIYNLNPKLKYNIPTLTSILLIKNPAQNSKETQNKQIYTLKKNEIFRVSDNELEQIIGTELRREQIFKDIFNQQNVKQIYKKIEKQMNKVEREIDQIQITSQKKSNNASTMQNLERVTYSYFSKGVDSMQVNVKNKVQKLKDDIFNQNFESSLQNQQLKTISFNNKKSTPGFHTSKNENQRMRPAFEGPQLNMHLTNEGDFMILGENTDVPSKISENEFRQKKGFFTKRAMKRGASIGVPVVNTQPIQKKGNVLSEKIKQFPQVNYNFKIIQQTQEIHQNSRDQSYLNQRAKSLNQTTELQPTDFQSTIQPSDQRRQVYANNLTIKTSEAKQKIEIRAKTPQNQRYINEKLVTERGITSQPFSNMMENINDTLNSQVNKNIQNFDNACKHVDSDFKDISTANDIDQSQEKNQIYSLNVSLIKNHNSLLKR